MNRNMNFELDPLSKLRIERDQQLKDMNNQQNTNNHQNINNNNSMNENINLVRMVEDNIENFNEHGNMNFLKNNKSMELSNNNFINENLEIDENFENEKIVDDNYINKIDMVNKIEKEGIVKTIWDDIKEYMIIILLFTLLSFDNVVLFFRNSIPFLNTLESTVPAKLLRGLLLVILLFIIKRKI